MAIVNLPNDPRPKTAYLRVENVTTVVENPFTFQQDIYSWQGQRWVLSVNMPLMKRAAAEPWLTAFVRLEGRRNTFNFGDPLAVFPRGEARSQPGIPMLREAHATQSGILKLDGLPASVDDWLKEGDYIQLGGGNNARLHKAMEDVATNAAGQADIPIWPNLRGGLADNYATIVLQRASGVFRLADDNYTYQETDHGMYEVGFEAVEAL